MKNRVIGEKTNVGSVFGRNLGLNNGIKMDKS